MDDLDPNAILAELAAEGAQQPAPSASTLGVYGKELSEGTLNQRAMIVAQAERGGPTKGVARIRYSHADCIDRMLASPGISNNDLAVLYGVTPAWISIVTHCDAFKTAYAERKAELIDPVLAATLNERFGALAARSVEVLMEKMNQPIEKISDKLALEAASLGARSVGMGEAPKGGTSAVDHLAALAHRLADLNRPVGTVVDGETRIL